MAKRWRKEPFDRRRFCQSPRGFDLRENGKIIARVRPKLERFHDVAGWYWYGFSQNTALTPVATAQEAKEQAMKWIKENKKVRQDNERPT